MHSAPQLLISISEPFSVETRFALEEQNIILRKYDYQVAERPVYSVLRDMDRVLRYSNKFCAWNNPDVLTKCRKNHTLAYRTTATHFRGGGLADLLALQFFARSGNGSLFNAVRTELRVSYGFQAGFMNYNCATGMLFISGEIETAKLEQDLGLIRNTYESYRPNPDLTDFDDLRREIAEATTRNLQHGNVATRTIVDLAPYGLDPDEAPRLGEILAGTIAQEVQERLAKVFLLDDEFIVVVADPDASVLAGAWIITKIKQVA